MKSGGTKIIKLGGKTMKSTKIEVKFISESDSVVTLEQFFAKDVDMNWLADKVSGYIAGLMFSEKVPRRG